MSALGLLGATVGTAVAGPAGGAAGGGFFSAVGDTLTNWFGGAARDADRQKRVDAYKQAALAGSVIAARVILGAPPNVASNEDPMWISAGQQVSAQRPDVWAAANSAGGLWVNGTIEMVQQELQTLSAQNVVAAGGGLPVTTTTTVPTPLGTAHVPLPSTTTQGAVQPLPAMITTASVIPSKISPLMLAGLAFGIVLVLLIARGRRHG